MKPLDSVFDRTRRLPPIERYTALALLALSKRTKEGLVADVTVTDLARLMGRSRRRITDAVGRLERAGIIRRLRRGRWLLLLDGAKIQNPSPS